MTLEDQGKPANTQKTYYITPADLPLSCPMSDMKLWNAHPKVYLPIEKTGEARCPYCSAHYHLQAPKSSGLDVEKAPD